MKRLMASLMLCAGIGAVYAQSPGDFDPAYGGSGPGYTTTWLGDSAQAHDLVLFADGSKVTSGIIETAGVSEPVLTRYKPDGNIDFGFGAGGHAVVSGMADAPNGYTQLTRYRDQLYLLVPAGNRLYVYNYSSAGALNAAFGVGGVAVVDMATPNWVVDIAMQRSRIILAARIRHPVTLERDFALVALTPGGVLDPAFGAGGIAIHSLSAGVASQEHFTGLAVLPDYRIVAGGRSAHDLSASDPHDFVVARFRIDGSVDPSFGSTAPGFTRIDFGYNDYGRRVAVYRNYQVLIAGSVCKTLGPTLGSYCTIGTARLLHDGSLDPSWNGIGTQVTDLGGDGLTVTDVALDHRERALVSHVWYRSSSADHHAGLTRYDFLGNLDPAFAAGGHGLYQFGYPLNGYHTVKVLDSKYVHTCGYTGKEAAPTVFAYGMVAARHYNY